MNGLSLQAAAREEPDAIALIFEDQAWTFADLARRVALVELGSAPLRIVGANDLATLLNIYAALEQARPLYLLHPRWPERERRLYLDHLATGDWVAGRSAAPDDPESILAVLPTSGSSGAPKAVALARRAFTFAAAAHAERLGWHKGDAWLLSLPLAHVGGLSILIRCLIARRTLVVPPPGRSFDPVELTARIERHHITLLSLVPTMLASWLERARRPEALRAVLLGGAAASPVLMARALAAGWPLLPTYGLTEACAQVATCTPGSTEEGCGRPLAGLEIRIAPDGRIEVRGQTLMSGYLPAPTAGNGLEPDGSFRTGDLGAVDTRGCLQVFGRQDDVIVTGGENVQPLEVEAALLEHESVAAAAVFGVADPLWGQRVVACVVAAGELDVARLESFLRERLAAFKVPRQWHLLQALPMTAGLKLDRRALRLAIAG